MTVDLGNAVISFSSDTSGLSSGMGTVRSLLGSLPGIVGIAGAAVAGIGLTFTKMAGDFQSGLTSLVTGAGEAESNLGLVSAGMLKMSVDTATSTQQLTSGLYMIESAGYHGAAGLQVLQNAAEGARVGNADLGTVADATTTIMKDYGISAANSAQAVNILVATVAAGKTHMQDLAGALSQILPTSSAAHVGLNDVMGAMATMTAEGVPAANAATYLRQTILALDAPGSLAVKTLQEVGLTSQEVATEMQRSLPLTLQMITEAVGKKFPAGSAAYVAAIKDISGGSKTMQGMLDLTGAHLQAFKDNVVGVGGAVEQGGKSITGWALVQQDFNFQMDRAKESLEAFGIKIGTLIMPYVSQFLSFLSDKGMPILTQLSDWVTKTAIPNLQIFGKWFINEAIPYVQGLADTVGRNLLPPLESLIENAIGITEGIGNWLVQSGFLSAAISDLSGLLGTLVGWVSDFISGLRDGDPWVSALAGGITAVGTAIGLIKIEEFGAGIYNSFQKMQDGAGIVANLANKELPNLGKALGWTQTAVEGVGTASTEAEATVATSAAGMTAAMGIATAGISVAFGIIAALWISTQNDITVGAHKMSTDVQKVYDSMGNSAADNAAKAKAAQISAANDTTNELMNQGSRASAAWAGSYDKQVTVRR